MDAPKVVTGLRSPGLNGTKLRAVWDAFRRLRSVGIQPGFSPEPPTQAGSLCYIVFRTVERSLRAIPAAIALHPEWRRDGLM
jgi:hypothetical protein